MHDKLEDGCGHKDCVFHGHLRLGTHDENLEDRWEDYTYKFSGSKRPRASDGTFTWA